MNASVRFHRMAQRQTAVDRIAVSASFAFPFKNPGCLQVHHNFLNRSFGDADPMCDIPQPCMGILIEANQDVRVIGQKGPVRVRYETGPFIARFFFSHAVDTSKKYAIVNANKNSCI